MRFKSGTFKLAGGALLLSTALIACNDSDFKSNPDARVVRKPEPAAPAAPVDDADQTPVPEEEPEIPVVKDEPKPITGVEVEVSRLPDSISQIFSSSAIKDGIFPFALDLSGSQTEFTLKNASGDTADNSSQVTRSLASESTKQGGPGVKETETFSQANAKGIVDIVVVIDDSGSMANEQENLSKGFTSLIGSLAGTDWRIGVITTSAQIVTVNGTPRDMCRLTLIQSDVGTPAQQNDAFLAAIKVGTGGNGNEEGFRQAINGLKCEEELVTVNGQLRVQSRPKWVRADSTVAVLIVSDEDNCSSDKNPQDGLGDGCAAGTLGRSKDDLINFVERDLQREVGVNAGFYGIISQPASPCATADNIGRQYQSWVDHKGAAGKGAAGDICQADYSNTLKQISQNIAALLESKFLLKKTPDAGTLELTVNGTKQILNTDFTLVNNSITFAKNREPAAGSQIVATYEVGARIITDSFTLSDTPAANTLKVAVNNVEVNSADIQLTGKTIKFLKGAPPADATIASTYRRNDKTLLSRFRLSQPALGNAVAVKVDGKAVSNFSYDAAKQEVVFNDPPADGAAIEMSYSFNKGPELKYTVVLANNATDIRVLDGTRSITFNRNGNDITIGSGDFVVGKKLTVTFDLPDANRSFTLPQAPIAGSEALQTTSACTLNNGIVLSGSNLTANCTITSRTDFVLSYKFIEKASSYTISDVADPNVGKFQVYVNGKETLDFVRTGSTIVLNFDPGLDAQVAVQYTLPE